MVKNKTKIYTLDNCVNFSIKYSSLYLLFEGLTNLNKYINKSLVYTTNPYVSASIITNVVEEVIPCMKDNLKYTMTRQKFTKKLSYGIGIITSVIISYGFDGTNYFVNLGFNLVKNLFTTYVMSKIDSYNKIDVVSLAIVINIIIAIPKALIMLSGYKCVLGILSIICILCLNKMVLNNSKQLNVLYYKQTNKINLINNDYVIGLTVASFINGLLSVFGVGLVINSIITIIVVPIIAYITTLGRDEGKCIVDNLNRSEGIIDGFRNGTETKEYLDKELVNLGIKNGFKGGLLYVITNVVFSYLGMDISPLLLNIGVNSFQRVCNDVKFIKSVKRINKIRLVK